MRLAVAIGAAVLAYLALGPVIVSPFWLIAPAVLFVGLMVLHLRIDKRRQFAGRAVRYYELGLKRLSDQWSGSGNPGDAFADANHPYASDLDLFGRGSLFELISTARTYEGEATLASWLKYPACARVRPGCVRGGSRTCAQRRPAGNSNAARRGDPLGGASEAPRGLGVSRSTHYFPGARIIAFLLAVTAVATFGGYWAGLWTSSVFLSAFLLGQVFAGASIPETRHILSSLHARAHDLTLLSALLAEVEKASFSSEKLKAIQASVQFDGRPASARIAPARTPARPP